VDRDPDRSGLPHRAHPRADSALSARRGALLVAALLIGGCTYLTHEKQGELIFRPTKDVFWGFNGGTHSFEEHWVPVGKDGQRLSAWWLAADKPNAPAVLYLHGARWNLTGSVTRIER
jgi:hypothetical protein